MTLLLKIIENLPDVVLLFFVSELQPDEPIEEAMEASSLEFVVTCRVEVVTTVGWTVLLPLVPRLDDGGCDAGNIAL